MNSIVQKMEELIGAGWNCSTQSAFDGWENRVSIFLREVFDVEKASDFKDLYNGSALQWKNARESQIGMLEGMVSKIEAQDVALKTVSSINPAEPKNPLLAQSSKVFVVHGHDSEAKESTKRFLEHLGLQPIILHEQANEGRTVIEKFEVYADVGFAVVLLTPDDVGAAKDESGNLRKRARQNVVLELGYFLGKLKRKRVCALYKSGVEIPSDYQGVLYTEMDARGAWKTALAQELSNAGLKIDLKALIGP